METINTLGGMLTNHYPGVTTQTGSGATGRLAQQMNNYGDQSTSEAKKKKKKALLSDPIEAMKNGISRQFGVEKEEL